MNRARPIEEVLNNPDVDENTKNAIRLIQDVKRFAEGKLDLEPTSNYNTFVNLNGGYANWVVTASHPLKLEPRTWHFPIVGTIPYIGFFEKEDAVEFRDQMIADKDTWYTFGSEHVPPDVSVRGAPAYSTLGWLPDPLYSSMISKSERAMADVVIHESMHATVFLGSNMDFNERLANFVGLEGSLKYIREKYGILDKAFEKALWELAGERIFIKFIERATAGFRAQVESIAKKNPQQALKAKEKFYRELPELYQSVYATEVKSVGKAGAKQYKGNFGNWNNAKLNGYRTYTEDFSIFYRLFKQCDKDIRRFINWIKTSYKTNEEPFKQAPDSFLKQMADRACPK